MPKGSLELDYFFNSDGTQNELVKHLGNCMTKNMYFILKDQVDSVETLYKIYIDDFTFHISRDLIGKITSIDNNDIINLQNYVNISNLYSIKNDAAKAFEVLESLLDKDEIVFVNTFMRKVPYYRTYIEDIVEQNNTMVDRHYFLALWHENDVLYYLDNIINHNKKHFVPYNKNMDIGVAKKAEFINAFNDQFSCFTIKPNIDELKEINKRMSLILKRNIENYNKEVVENTKGDRVFCGRNAIKELINICKEERFYLNEYVSTYVTDLSSRISVVFSRSCDRKRVLIYFLTKLSSTAFPDILKMIDAVKVSIDKMENARNIMLKGNIMQDYLIGTKYIEYFEEIILAEDGLYKLLEENIDQITDALVKDN